jgi:hypothetical protein
VWQIDVRSCRDVAGDTFVSVVMIMCSHHYSSRAVRSDMNSIQDRNVDPGFTTQDRFKENTSFTHYSGKKRI